MTETEWLSCADPKPMLRFLSAQAGDRKLRLFACACCRRIWPALTDERCRRAVEVRELYEDGMASEFDLAAAQDAARAARHELRYPLRYVENAESLPESAPAWAAGAASNAVNGNYHPIAYLAARAAACLSTAPWKDAVAAETGALCPILRDIVGNPFRPLVADPVWLTSTVVALAGAMYHARAFDRLPILADALEDAGCDNVDVLAHCRGAGPHVQGCWVVDLLLGKHEEWQKNTASSGK